LLWDVIGMARAPTAVPLPLFFVTADYKELAGAFLVTADCKGLTRFFADDREGGCSPRGRRRASNRTQSMVIQNVYKPNKIIE